MSNTTHSGRLHCMDPIHTTEEYFNRSQQTIPTKAFTILVLPKIEHKSVTTCNTLTGTTAISDFHI
uniref:Uncharacterized protein n=1 Tax=Anguilla anguilla TaxID=7936 RepID=A0A0E9RH51_ANGAN